MLPRCATARGELLSYSAAVLCPCLFIYILYLYHTHTQKVFSLDASSGLLATRSRAVLPPCAQRLWCDREDASSMVTAGATANTTVKNSRASRESGLLCSHSHGESIGCELYVMKDFHTQKGLSQSSICSMQSIANLPLTPPPRFVESGLL